MENAYGIGTANRYELFMMGEDDMTDFETVVKKKKEKKSAAAAPATGAQPTGTGVAPTAAKVQPQKAAGNVGNKENKQTKKVENGTGTANDQRRGIKEQNNKDNLSTIQRKDGGGEFDASSRLTFHR